MLVDVLVIQIYRSDPTLGLLDVVLLLESVFASSALVVHLLSGVWIDSNSHHSYFVTLHLGLGGGGEQPLEVVVALALEAAA